MAPDGVTAAPWVAWARFEEDCGNVEAAAALCRRASVRFPRDADVHAQWARLEVDQDRAREIIFAGLERCPHAIAASSNPLDGVEAHWLTCTQAFTRSIELESSEEQLVDEEGLAAYLDRSPTVR